MSPFLLDSNVLVALAWPAHVLHARAWRWFSTRGHCSWATCPFTQAAFVRILSNPSFSSHSLTPLDAIRLLEANLAHPNHEFWANGIPLATAIGKLGIRPTGHQQITDAYLLGLAMHRKGRLATMDQRIVALGNVTELLEVIP